MSNYPHRTTLPKIPGYYIYNDGRVQNSRTMRTLEVYWDDRSAAVYVNLRVPNKSRPGETYSGKFPLARLVWEAFMGKRASNHASIFFVDQDPSNCAIDNLRLEPRSNYGKRMEWDKVEGAKLFRLIQEGKEEAKAESERLEAEREASDEWGWMG